MQIWLVCMKKIALEENLDEIIPVAGQEELRILTPHVLLARSLLRTARTADEVRMAQAILLPADFKFSIEQTARAMARSTQAVTLMIEHFINSNTQHGTATATAQGHAEQEKKAQPIDPALLSEIISQDPNTMQFASSTVSNIRRTTSQVKSPAFDRPLTPAAKHYSAVLHSLRDTVHQSLAPAPRYKKASKLQQASVS
jgi:hypothetical protein